MYALTVKTKSQLEGAISRARIQKPKFREIEFGVYSVQSTDPKKPNTFYDTGIQSAEGDGYEVMCTCPTEPRKDKETGEIKMVFCKHVASVLPHYQMREKEEADKLRAAGLLCNNCGAEARVFFLAGNRFCWTCALELADAEADKDAAEAMLADTEAWNNYADLVPSFADEYTEEMAAKDRLDIFG